MVPKAYNYGEKSGTQSCYVCYSLQWRNNGRDSITNQQPYDYFLNRLFRRRSKKTSKLRVTGLCAGNSPETGEFPAQMARNAENVSIRWRHHGHLQCKFSLILKASYRHTVRRCSVEIVTLNFARQLGNAVSKTPVKIQNQRANLNPYLLFSCDLAVRLLTLGEYAIWCINRCNTGLEHMYRLECR